MSANPAPEVAVQKERPLWRLPEEEPRKVRRARPSAFRWVVEAALPLALSLSAGILALLPVGLTLEARLSVLAFAVTTVLWATTRLNAAYVGLSAVMVLVISGAVPQKQFFDALASDIIWLMIGAFVIAGALRETGLATRLTNLVVQRARTVGGAFWMLTFAVVPLAFFVPSTSARAAMALPVFHSLSRSVDDRKVTRALALLVPTIVLVSTVMTLIAAGSHLIANDLLEQSSGRSISFAQWAVFGVPFGVAASVLSCAVVMRLFLDRERRSRALPVTRRTPQPLAWKERLALGVVGVMIALWMTQGMHGLEIATVTMAGALVLCVPRLGVLRWQDGLKAVSWNLIIFVGAALVLGRALIDADVATLVIDGVFRAGNLGVSSPPLFVVVMLAAVTLTSHIYLPSHAARAAALVPPLLYFANALELNPVAVVLIGTVGIDYCLTFPISSKALLMYQELEMETFSAADLLRLSAVLLPLNLLLMVLFYFGYWQWTGHAL